MKTQYAADKPSDCRYCYYWKNKRTGCSLGKANCYYRISPPPKSKSDCDGCPYDKYKAAVKRGDKRIVYKNKKYEKQAKKREQRAALRRVDRLFEMIEKDNQKCKSFSVS